MTKPKQLVITTILVIVISTIIEYLYPNSFFILTTFGFLFTIILVIASMRKNSADNVNLASTENAHSQKMQALGQLSMAIAHDFNNILTAIIGYSDLLLKRHKTEDISYKDANHIKQNAARAANLVKQLLTFSKKSKIEPTNVDIGKTIKNLSSLIDQLMGGSISVSIECDEKRMFSLVDITQFEQVIINLAINARDAMRQNGQVKIKATSAKINQDFNTKKYFTPSKKSDIEHGEYIKISISDTGTGIDSEILKKIFEPFFSTKDQSGTGLGLATVSQIIKKMDGHIFVETQKNCGTTFHIYLKQVKNQHEENVKTKSTTPKTISNISKKYKILVVEDEDSVRLFSRLTLKDAGYNVDDVQNAEDALRLIENGEKDYDILLTDISLGNMDGIALAESIKSHIPDINIIFTSGYDQDALTNINIPSSTFLSKPYSLNDLIETTVATLKKS